MAAARPLAVAKLLRMAPPAELTEFVFKKALSHAIPPAVPDTLEVTPIELKLLVVMLMVVLAVLL